MNKRQDKMTMYEKQGRRYIPRTGLAWVQHIDPHALRRLSGMPD